MLEIVEQMELTLIGKNTVLKTFKRSKNIISTQSKSTIQKQY